MSFKRAGNDHCALRLQKKQRVAELFAEDIPADEVNQTRSGKYVCLVCPNKPVLDTMPMLSIHRQGKNHVANVSIKIEKDHNLKDILQKRKQELYLQQADVENGPTNVEPNLTEPFNDDLQTAPLLAKTKWLTKNVTIETPCESRSQKFTAKNIGAREETTTKSQHYNDKHSRSLYKKNKPFFQSRIEVKLGKDSLENDTQRTTSAGSKNASGTDLKLSKPNYGLSNEKDKGTDSGVTVGSQQLSASEGSSQSFRLNKEQQRRYLEMKKSGWILDWNGKWIKDENVEFDSDEEEPAHPL